MFNLVKRNNKKIESLTAAYLPLVESGKLSADQAITEILDVVGIGTYCVNKKTYFSFMSKLMKAEKTTKPTK